MLILSKFTSDFNPHLKGNEEWLAKYISFLLCLECLVKIFIGTATNEGNTPPSMIKLH